MKYKTLALLLTMAMIMAMLAGCGSNSSTETESATTAAETEETTEETSVATTEADGADTAETVTEVESEAEAEAEEEETSSTTYPLTEDDITFTMFATATSQVTNVIGDLNNHQGYIAAEEITGIQLDITTVSTDVGSEQLSLVVAAGEYPDLFRAANFANGTLDAYENEVIIELSDYLEDYAPNYSTLIASTDAIARDVVTDEGYYLDFYRLYMENDGFDSVSVTQGMMIRQDLLDDAGLEAPTTLDELTEVLKVFKTEYGLTDAVLLQAAVSNMGDSFISGLGIGSGFYAVDGTVYYGPTQEEYKEYLKLLNSWYNEGYLNSDFISYSTNPNDGDIIGKITSYDGVGVYFDSASNLETRNGAADEGVHFVGMADLQGPDGENHFGLDATIVKGSAYNISTQCEYPELAVQWCDFWYSDEGILLTNYGIEGESFEYDENGDPQWTDLILNNADGLSQSVCRQVYLMYTVHGICINDNEVNMLSEEAKEAVSLWTESSDRAYLLPSVSYTTDESLERATLLNDIETLSDQVILQMVVGQLDIDSYWDTFQSELISMGIEDVIQITQDALDRYYER